MTSARRRVTAFAVTLVLGLAATACGGDKKRDGTAANPVLTSPPAVAPGHSPDVTTTRGPQPPEQGTWLGAWVKPQWNTPTGRAEAFAAFERQLGTQLRIAHAFHEWDDEFPGPTEDALGAEADLLMVSWAGTDTRSMAMGVYDPVIRQRAERVKAYGRPLLLRFRWEMDRPNLAASVHSPEDYIAAWRHTRQIFTEVGATNAGWVWCPHVQGFIDPQRNAAAYYPGDDQVDWLCTDVYAGAQFDGFAAQMNTFMAFASKHPRPILVGEFGVTERGQDGQRATWLREVRSYTRDHPQIKALVYFAAKQERKPVYDTTFTDDPGGLAAFRELAADDYFNAPLAATGGR